MPAAAVESSTPIQLPCSVEVRRRDGIAWRMGLTGYSAREIADVVAGHLSLGAVQQARARVMAGHPRSEVAAFLEAQWREPRPEVSAVVPPTQWTISLAELEPDLVRLATQHGLAPALVRAVIAAESGGDARAVSSAGAVGLMQLMPATAAALGVNPWRPHDNLRGGIVYLAGLLRDFGNSLRLALIAYNAGPQHARAVQAGRAVAYRETRAYLDAIRKRYPIP
jgi:soluble lytic murein transglycosylase-like protein